MFFPKLSMVSSITLTSLRSYDAFGKSPKGRCSFFKIPKFESIINGMIEGLPQNFPETLTPRE